MGNPVSCWSAAVSTKSRTARKPPETMDWSTPRRCRKVRAAVRGSARPHPVGDLGAVGAVGARMVEDSRHDIAPSIGAELEMEQAGNFTCHGLDEVSRFFMCRVANPQCRGALCALQKPRWKEALAVRVFKIHSLDSRL